MHTPPSPAQASVRKPLGRSETQNVLTAGCVTRADHQANQAARVRRRLGQLLDEDCGVGALGRLGSYNVLEILGSGSYGIVVKAFDERLTRFVALKLLSPEHLDDALLRRRFLREARIAGAIRHPNVVQIYGVEEAPVPCIVMEYVDGRTLHDFIKDRGALSQEDLIRLGSEITQGLAAAHELGIVHRDIKPGNILLTGDSAPRIKLADFGTARTANEITITMSGFHAGTPMFMSPEQLGDEEVDARSDLFSLGSVLYMMAAGKAPFSAKSVMSILHQVAHEDPEPLAHVRSDLPTGVCELIGGLLQKDPNQRVATAAHAVAALRDCVSQPVRRQDRSRRRSTFSAVADLFGLSKMKSAS